MCSFVRLFTIIAISCSSQPLAVPLANTTAESGVAIMSEICSNMFSRALWYDKLIR